MSLTFAGLILKLAAVFRCVQDWRCHRQYWQIPELGFCLIFSMLVYAQIGMELYSYHIFFLKIESTAFFLLKLYYVVILATLFCLPIAIDVVVLNQARVGKAVLCLMLWASLSIALCSTEWFIVGFKVMPPTFTRIPGPAYDLIPVVGLLTLIYVVLRLILIAHKTDHELVSTKASNLLIAICQLLLASISVSVLMKLDAPITGSGILGLSMGLLMFILAGQFNNARIFDLRVLIPGTSKWKSFWQHSRHLHTVSVDPGHCRGLIDSYTENLIQTASRICSNQQQMAQYLGFSQATISRRMRRLIQNESMVSQSDSE